MLTSLGRHNSCSKSLRLEVWHASDVPGDGQVVRQLDRSLLGVFLGAVRVEIADCDDRCALDFWEVVDDDVDIVLDQADALGAKLGQAFLLLRFECHKLGSRDVAPLANKLVVIPDLELLTVSVGALAASLLDAGLFNLAVR